MMILSFRFIFRSHMMKNGKMASIKSMHTAQAAGGGKCQLCFHIYARTKGRATAM